MILVGVGVDLLAIVDAVDALAAAPAVLFDVAPVIFPWVLVVIDVFVIVIIRGKSAGEKYVSESACIDTNFSLSWSHWSESCGNQNTQSTQG